jgi:hypothetical protein
LRNEDRSLETKPAGCDPQDLAQFLCASRSNRPTSDGSRIVTIRREDGKGEVRRLPVAFGDRRCQKLLTHFEHLAGQNRQQGGSTLCDQRQQIGQTDRSGPKDHDGDATLSKVLLLLDPFVRSQKRVASVTLHQVFQLAIYSCRQSLLPGRSCSHFGETSLAFSRNALVEQNLHSRLLTTSDFARSRAATAFAGVTVGKSSGNSSSVCPPSK